MRPTLDINALRTFVVGTDLGSFARAASKLGRSQSAVCMQLKKLEQQAGHALLRRNGRGLVPTEAGDALLAYARRIITLHDEAAASLGATPTPASVRIGLPQDFVEDVVPDVVRAFSRQRPGVHVEVSAGRNYALEEDVRSGRLDIAIAFFAAGSDAHGTVRIASLPMLWLGARGLAKPCAGEAIPLVLYDHPCLFRQTALQMLDRNRFSWRPSLTTPSLPGVWAALRSGLGISIRTAHRVPAGICDVGRKFGLPKLPAIELRMVTADALSPAASELRDILDRAIRDRVIARNSKLRR
jgi:DNA-binding transcriptional LysR family regulator